MSHKIINSGLSGKIKSEKSTNERLRELVNEKVIILEFPRDTRWECCTLDLVLFRNLDIFSHSREGFTAEDVNNFGTYISSKGEVVPVIYLKSNRKQTTLTEKEMKRLIEFME
jgi:hypothetical protein